MTGRGTDSATERRKAGPRATRKVGVEKWIESVFYGGSEVVVCGFPALFVLMNAPFNVEVKFAALVVLVTLTLAIGTVRDGRIESLEWPPLTPVLFVIRVSYHSAVIAIAAYGGAAVDLLGGTALGSLLIAVLLSLGAVWLFPRLVARVRGLGPWWTWGR